MFAEGGEKGVEIGTVGAITDYIQPSLAFILGQTWQRLYIVPRRYTYCQPD